MWPNAARSVPAAAFLLAIGFSAVLVVGGEGYDGSDLRIVGGFPASQAATMHQVSIRVKSSDEKSFGSGHICGGSLINNHTVLTAAHCLVDGSNRKRAANYFRVVGGNLNLTVTSANSVILDVSQVVIHQRYNPANFEHDVGLLILSSIVPATHPTLRPIQMIQIKPNAGVVCQTSGWGTPIFGQNIKMAVLMAVNVTVQATNVCNGTSSYNGFIKNGMLCAGDVLGNKDACQGDSGGPLVCNGVLAGIVSNGKDCGLANFPGIYADVAHYREWILTSDAQRTTVAGGMAVALVALGLLYGKFVQRLTV
nr:trypsin alpha-3-like [Aedes albopictus]